MAVTGSRLTSGAFMRVGRCSTLVGGVSNGLMSSAQILADWSELPRSDILQILEGLSPSSSSSTVVIVSRTTIELGPAVLSSSVTITEELGPAMLSSSVCVITCSPYTVVRSENIGFYRK